MALSSSQNPALTLLPNLLLILAVATGIIITEPSLPNDRKLRPAPEVAADGTVKSQDSYFWEDPFKNLDRYPPSRDKDKLLEALVASLKIDKVVFVGLEGGPSPANVERRIRTRLAIAHALSARAGMFRCAETGLTHASIPAPGKEGAYGVAVECFRSGEREIASGTVAVVYLDEARVRPTPANIIHAVASAVPPDSARALRCSYIGLCRSDHFGAFLKTSLEDIRMSGAPQGRDWNQPEFRIYSPHATLDDRFVMHDWRDNRRGPGQKGLSFLGPNYRFPTPDGYGVLHRVGAHDGELAEALVAELHNRGIHPAGKSRSVEPGKIEDAVLLLADMDRLHSRMLVKTFESKWGKKASSRSLRVIHYPEALDALGGTPVGSTPAQPGGVSSQSKPATQSTSGTPARGNPGGVHAAEGFIQFDSLSRLPARIRELEREDGVRYRAVGLFGSDVHDKLQILRALRPGFPQALFFTNDLDARLWQGENRGDSINLMVAGAFGLSMNGEIQGSATPFRSSYQTATYLACLHAIGYSPKGSRSPSWLESGLTPHSRVPTAGGKQASTPNGVRREVEIHEVGRTGDQLLAFYMAGSGTNEATMKPHAPGRPLSVQRKGPAEKTALRFFRIVIGILFVVILFQLWLTVLRRCGRTEPLTPAEWGSMDRLDRFIRSKLPGFLFPDSANGESRTRGGGAAPPAPVSLNSSLAALTLTLIVALLFWLASDLSAIFSQEDGTSEGGAVFAGVSAKPVIAANFVIIAIGLVMIHVSLRPQFIAYPYPFRAPPSGDSSPGASKSDSGVACDPGPGRPPDMDDPSSQSSSGDAGLANNKDLPSLRDAGGWLSGIYCYLRQKDRRHLPDGIPPWLQEMFQCVGRAQCDRRNKCAEWITSSSPGIAWAFARERLVNRSGSVMCRVLIYLLLGFIVHLLIFKGESDLGAPSSIRGETMRRAFSIGDTATKVILTIVAAIAMDRQLMLMTGLEKLHRFLKKRTLLEAENDELEPPYPWHDRPEVVYITKEAAEERFGVGSGADRSGHEGFWEMPLLRTAAVRFREVSPSLVMPFILAFLVLVTRHPVFENIPFPISELVFFGFILLGPLAAGMLAQHCMARVFTATQERLRRGLRFVAKTEKNERKAFLDGEVKAAEELEGRTRFGFFGNPLVEAILLPLGGYGVLEFSGVLASLLK